MFWQHRSDFSECDCLLLRGEQIVVASSLQSGRFYGFEELELNLQPVRRRGRPRRSRSSHHSSMSSSLLPDSRSLSADRSQRLVKLVRVDLMVYLLYDCLMIDCTVRIINTQSCFK